MSNYHLKLPVKVNPDRLPLTRMAPCWDEGEVNTVDDETKDAICHCRYLNCFVDRSNQIEMVIRDPLKTTLIPDRQSQ